MAAGKFEAQQTTELREIEQRRDDAQRRLIRLSRLAPDAALRIEVGKAEEGDQQVLDDLPRVRAEVDRLELAYTAAWAADQSRRADRFVADDQARRKAVAAHLSRALTAWDKASSALEAAVANYVDFRQAVVSAHNAQPSDLRVEDVLGYQFAEARTGRLFIAELARLAEAKGVANAVLAKSPFVSDLRNGRGELVPMRAHIAAGIDRIRADLRDGAHKVADRVAEKLSAAAHSPAAKATAGVASPPAPAVEPSPQKLKVA